MASRLPSSTPGRVRYPSARQTEAYLMARELVRRVRRAASASMARQPGNSFGPLRREQG